MSVMISDTHLLIEIWRNRKVTIEYHTSGSHKCYCSEELVKINRERRITISCVVIKRWADCDTSRSISDLKDWVLSVGWCNILLDYNAVKWNLKLDKIQLIPESKLSLQDKRDILSIKSRVRSPGEVMLSSKLSCFLCLYSAYYF